MLAVRHIFDQHLAPGTSSNIGNLDLKPVLGIRHSVHHKGASPRSLSNQLPTAVADIALAVGTILPFPSLAALVTEILIAVRAFYLLHVQSYIRHMKLAFRALLAKSLFPILGQPALDRIHLIFGEPCSIPAISSIPTLLANETLGV